VTSSSSNTNSFTHSTALAAGTWYFRVRATDNLNNASSYSSAGSVVIDTTGPGVPGSVSSSDHSLSTWSTDQTITMIWNASTDSASGLAGYSYIFDTLTSTVPDTTQDIGTVTTITSGTLADGNSHYFHIRAVDALGNWGQTVHVGPFYIDTADPSTPGTPSTTTPTSNTTPTWVWNASVDSGSGLAVNAYTVDWSDSADFSSNPGSDTSETNTFTQPDPLSDGVWYFRVKAEDALGNETAYSSSGSVEINTGLSNSAPNLPQSLGATSMVDGSYGTDSTPALTFSLSDPDISDTLQYQIQIDDSSNFGSPIVDYISALAAQGSTSFTVGQSAGSGTYNAGSAATTLADGNYYWRVKALDNSGSASDYNVANSGAVAFRVDTTAPSVPASLTGQSPIGSSFPSISWNASTDTGSGSVSYTVGWCDNSDFTGCNANTDTTTLSSFSIEEALADGTWYFRVYASDASNNNSANSSAITVNIDTTAPTTPGTPSTTTPTTDTTPTWTWTASTDSNSGLDPNQTYTIEWCTDNTFDECNNLATSDTNSYTHSTALTDGTWYIRIKAIDLVGNISAYSSDSSAVIDSTAPVISAVDVTESGSSATITWTTDETASSEIEYGLNTSYLESSGVTDTSPRVTNHSVALSGLTECSEYYYKVVSVDSLSQERTSTGSFITTGCLGGAAVISSTTQDISTSGGSVSLISSGSGVGITAPDRE
jgi:nitrogen fixation protein FixH